MIDLWLFLAKYAFLGLLYLFLFWAIRAVSIEARQLSAAPGRIGSVLRVVTEDGTTHEVPLVRTVTIGRLPDNDMTLDDSSISGHHARIARRSEGWVLEDLGSSNGTFFNDERLAERQKLSDGDRIRVGRTAISVELNGVP